MANAMIFSLLYISMFAFGLLAMDRADGRKPKL